MLRRRGLSNRSRRNPVKVRHHFARIEDSSSSSEEDDLVSRRSRRRVIPSEEAKVIKRKNATPIPFKKLKKKKKNKDNFDNIRVINLETFSQEKETSGYNDDVVRKHLLPLRNYNENDDSSSSGSDEEEGEEEDENEGSGVVEDDDDDDEFRLMFVPKGSRKIKSKEELEREKEEEIERQLKLEEKRKKKTKEKFLRIIQDVERKKNQNYFNEEEEDLPDDNDEINPESEYDLWVEREKLRIIRDLKERTKYDREQADIQRRRNMTESERKLEDERLEKLWAEKRQEKEDNKKFEYMQRYTKKGIFFQGEDIDGKKETIYDRDIQVPTFHDKKNYKMLPKVLQNKYFGQKGQSKWTHLSNEDTSEWEGPWGPKRDEDDVGNKRRRDEKEDPKKRRKM